MSVAGTTDHRPWPMPARPWMMQQKWHDLLFMHWPVEPGALRPLIPDRIEIETHDGSAWVGVVPFRMSGIRLRGFIPIPGTVAFPELNVRTYVRVGGKPGVWFFSLDAASALAVSAARRWFHLPYFNAQMNLGESAEGNVRYRSHRTHRGAAPAEFRARYRPIGESFRARPGTLDYFLTERFCLYAGDKHRVFRGDIHHEPWSLQPGEADTEANTVAAAAGIVLPPTNPVLHFARNQDVKIWSLQEIK
jgi:uncharacterized protein YqjF (DUF2071 family)